MPQDKTNHTNVKGHISMSMNTGKTIESQDDTAGNHGNLPLHVAFSILESATPVTKSFTLTDGGIKKSSSVFPSAGVVRRVSVEGTPRHILNVLADRISAFGANDVLIPAPCSRTGDEHRLSTRAMVTSAPDSVARTKDFFPAADGPCLVGMDFDLAELPECIKNKLRPDGERYAFTDVFAAICPSFRSAASLTRNSVSYGVRSKDGAHKTGLTGFHRYFIGANGHAVAEGMKRLAERLILAGFIWIKVSEAGTLLPRTIFDIAASSDMSRLFFEANAQLGDGLEYVKDARKCHLKDDGLLDLSTIAPLTDDERRALADMIEDAKADPAIVSEAARKAAAHRAGMVETLVTKKGLPRDRAEAAVARTLDTEELDRDWPIHLDDGRIVFVGDIVDSTAGAASEGFDGLTCADPLELDYNGGRNVAIIRSRGGVPYIYSQAHGGREFTLPQRPLRPEDFFQVLSDTEVKREDDLAQLQVAILAEIEPLSSGVLPNLPVVSGAIDAEKIPVREWLVSGRLPLNGVFQLVGEPGISKSSFTLRDALAIASGREDILRGVNQHGRPITRERLHRHGPSLIYNAEDTYDEMQRRLAVGQKAVGIDGAMLHGITLWSGLDHGRLTLVEKTRNAPPTIAHGACLLVQAIRRYGAVHVVLDTQISLARGLNENDNIEMDFLLGVISAIGKICKCSITVVHHTSKATRDDAGDIGGGRGAFSVVGAVRSHGTLTHPTKEDHEEWGTKPEDDYVKYVHGKLNTGKKDKTPIVYRKVGKPVGNGNGSRPLDARAWAGDASRDELEAFGDTAALLQIADVAELMARKQLEQRDDAKGAAVAAILAKVIETVGERQNDGTRRVRFNDVRGFVAKEFDDAKLTSADTKQKLQDYIKKTLSVDGAAFDRDGKRHVVTFRKDGALKNSSWCLHLAEAPTTSAPSLNIMD